MSRKTLNTVKSEKYSFIEDMERKTPAKPKLTQCPKNSCILCPDAEPLKCKSCLNYV